MYNLKPFDDLDKFIFANVNGTITIPAPTGTPGGANYTTTTLDFSSQAPTDMYIHFYIMRIGTHQLPYHDTNQITYVSSMNFSTHVLTIKSNSVAWNNFSYSILLIYKR